MGLIYESHTSQPSRILLDFTVSPGAGVPDPSAGTSSDTGLHSVGVYSLQPAPSLASWHLMTAAPAHCGEKYLRAERLSLPDSCFQVVPVSKVRVGLGQIIDRFPGGSGIAVAGAADHPHLFSYGHTVTGAQLWAASSTEPGSPSVRTGMAVNV